MRKSEDLDLEIIFPKRLVEAMQDKGIDETDMEADGILSVSALKEYQRNMTRLPSLRSAVRIATYLEVSLDWLCGLDESEQDDWSGTDVVYF